MLKQQVANNEKIKEIKDKQIKEITIPGLKTHICSLVAPDSPADKWMPVYVHSKIMIINDVFTTHGSANINTRSMETDSEMNIAHDWAEVTKSLRKRLWQIHTNGLGIQDDLNEAFLSWEKLLKQNEDNQQPATKAAPEASLVKFFYNEPTLKDQD